MSNLVKQNNVNDVAEVKSDDNKIDLTASTKLDISNLSTEAQSLLKQKAVEAQLDIHKKAQEAQIDIQGTKLNLDNLNSTVRESTKDGTSITVTHTQTTSIGRTEVMMGNTERAAAGKISRSGAGLDDNTMKIVIVVAIVAVVIVLLLK